jgi:hypothetical protein
MNRIEMLTNKLNFHLDDLLLKPVLVERCEPLKILEDVDPRPVSLNNLESYIERVFGPMPFNPSDEQRIAAMKETYEETCIPDVTLESEMPPTPAGFRRIYDHLTDDYCKTLIWLGRRGSGKTLALNYFLSENFRQLNYQENSTFFRCDVAKISLLNEGIPTSVPVISISEYVTAHAFYVALRWGRKDTLLNSFDYSSSTTGTDGFTKFLMLQPDKERFAKLIIIWAQLRDKYQETQRTGGGSGAILFIPETVREIARPHPGAFRDLFRFMMILIRENGKDKNRRSGRVINIIDGVDNLLQRPTTENLRIDYLKQLLPYLPGGEDGAHFDKNVLVMRNDSFAELCYLGTSLRVAGPNDGKIVIKMAQVQPEAILRRKRKAATNPDSALIRTWLSSAQINGHEKGMERFQYITEILLNQMQSAGSFLHKPGEGKQWSAIDCLFNGNIRSFSRNIVRSYSYVERFGHLDNRKISLDDLKEAARQSDHSKVTSIWRVLLEGSITAGSSFLISNSIREVRGRWCPNFFDFQRIVGHERWGGLITLRLIQLIRNKEDFYTISSAVDTISKVFGYPKDQVLESTINARDFGLLEYGSMLTVPSSEKLKRHTTRSPALKTTMKGEYVLSLAFSNVPAMYFMALATPLLSSEFSAFSKNDLVHDVKPLGRRNFPATAFTTSVIFMRHVVSAHQLDMVRAQKVSQVGTGIIKDLAQNCNTVFPLPDLTEWKKEIVELFKRFCTVSPKQAESVLLRFGIE